MLAVETYSGKLLLPHETQSPASLAGMQTLLAKDVHCPAFHLSCPECRVRVGGWGGEGMWEKLGQLSLSGPVAWILSLQQELSHCVSQGRGDGRLQF